MSEYPTKAAVELLGEALGRGQHPFLSVTSDSMAPLFRQGDQLQLGPATLGSLRVGDVVVISLQDELLAHRYWGMVESDGVRRLITRGDRLTHFDPLVSTNRLLAIVIGRKRSDRYLDLQHGLGNWLNRRLLQIVGLQDRALGRARPAPEQQSNKQIPPSMAGRIMRRFLLSVGVLLAWMVDKIA